MAARPISEATTKNLLNEHMNDCNFQKSYFYSFSSREQLINDCLENQWLTNSNLVVKVDQGIKRRGKLGLVGLDITLDKVLSWISQHIDNEIQIGSSTGLLKNFIIEPFLEHKESEEHYLCIYSSREYDTILFYHEGGVDVGDVDSKAAKLEVPVNCDPSPKDINDSLLQLITCITTKRALISFISDLYRVYRQLYFTYLEINPLVIKNGGKIYALDAAAKLDECAHYLMKDSWGSVTFPPPFGRDLYPEEETIAKMNASSGASLKLTVINPLGRIWTLVAGGGASVIFTDTICEYGGIDDLANYGEYSGAPSEQQTYEYTSTITRLMFKTPPLSEGKILIIGGGIANFTNVSDTFKGIIRSLEESKSDLKAHGVSVFVRRGGPNYQEGLRHMVELGERIDVPFHVFGPETHMTAIVGMALGKREVMDNHAFGKSSTTANFLLSFGFESWKKKGNPSLVSNSIDVLPSTTDDSPLFSSKTRAIVWGMHQTAVQSMLDFDYSCSREFPSVAAVVNPFVEDYRHRFYWGQKEIFIHVYSNLTTAFEKHTDVDVFINFASLRTAYSVTMEAMDCPRIRTIAIIAEGIPENMTRKLIAEAKRIGHVTIIGPATVGGVKGGCFKIGNTAGMMDNILSSKLYQSGSVAYVSKSGGMSNELNNIIARCTDGVNEGIAIGGDRYPCTTFMDHIYRFERDPSIKMIVVLGEVGGCEEYSICDALKAGSITKPLIAWCIGTCSTYFSTDVQFGHAGSSAHSSDEMSVVKNKALAEAGAYVPDSFDSLVVLISDVYTKNVQSGNIVPVKDVPPPPVPMDYQWARELGLIRKPATVTSSICDERGCELLYAGIPVSSILSRKMGIGGVLSLLWFKKALPVAVTEFIEMSLMLVADHGPAVSAAMNTIVSSRAGKDLVSSLCSGLLTIGDRFGGAVDAAGRAFFDSVNSGTSPDNFVRTKRKNNQYIMGIGHRVKSIGNPDKRVEILTKYVKDRFESTPILDFALSVEAITTAKRPNLILNIDGAIGACFVELLTKCFTNEEVYNYINAGVLNAIFVLGRSIGLIGHHIDQKILRQDLYRHPWDDISYMNPEN